MAKKLTNEEQAVISASDAGYVALTAELAEKVLQSDPENLRVLVEYGHALRRLGRYTEAEVTFEKAIELCEPGKRDVIFGEVGNLYRSLGKPDVAAEWFEKQIAEDPDDATGHLFWGAMLLALGRVDSAVDVLQKGETCRLGCLEELHYTLAIAFRAKRDYVSAAKHLKTALSLDPGYAPAKLALKDVQSASSKT